MSMLGVITVAVVVCAEDTALLPLGLIILPITTRMMLLLLVVGIRRMQRPILIHMGIQMVLPLVTVPRSVGTSRPELQSLSTRSRRHEAVFEEVGWRVRPPQ